jgi:hypothetical protein
MLSADIQTYRMKPMKTIVLLVCLAGFLPIAASQTKAPKRIAAAEAKDHVGEAVMVCGKVVDTKIPRYAIGNNGKPVQVDVDQPEPNPVFYFVTFSTDPHKPELVGTTYMGKQVCVAGTLSAASGAPFIVVKDPAEIKIQAGDKK